MNVPSEGGDKAFIGISRDHMINIIIFITALLVRNLLMVNLLLYLKKLNQIIKLPNLMLVIE